MNRNFTIMLVLAAGVFSRAAIADDAFDDRFYATALGSYARSASGSNYENGYGGRLIAGKSVIPHLSFELIASDLHYQGKFVSEPGSGNLCGLPILSCPNQEVRQASTDIAGVGAGVNAFLFGSNHGLYAHVDGMAGNEYGYDGGVGFLLPLFHQGLGLRVEALYHKANPIRWEPLFNAGLFIPLGDAPVAVVTAPEPPPAVVPEAAPPPPPPPSPPPPPPPCKGPEPGQPISLAGCSAGDTIVLHGVNFDFNSANLTLNAKALLDEVSKALRERSDMKVEVDGHTDGVGGIAYNQKLSERRAESVKAYLVSAGVDEVRLGTRGFGKSKPVADNGTEEGRELNRRVELKVVYSNPADAPVPQSGSDTAPAGAAAADALAPEQH